MKLLKLALILNLALMVNVGYALEMPNDDVRALNSGADLTFPIHAQVEIISFQQFNVGAGADLSISSPTPSWGVCNRTLGSSCGVPIITGGNIALDSPISLGTAGSTLLGPRISLAASAIPEAETYSMLLAGLGVIGAIIRRRSI